MSETLVTAVAVAVCALGGVPWPLVATLAVGSWAPVAGLAALGAIALARRRRPPGTSDEAVVLAALGAELRRGASLRTAIDPAASRSARLDLTAAVRLAEAGAPVDRVASAFGGGLPGVGRLAGPAFEAATTSGGRAAFVFARLSERASAHLELLDERRSLTAQARLSAFVVGGIPCLVLGAMAATGQVTDIVAAGPVGAVLVGAGSLLMLAGLAVVVALTRRVLG